MTLKAIAHCAIGVQHQNNNLPCQDAADYRIIENICIGAVADGAGSAKYADIGAHIAVQSVLARLTTLIHRLKQLHDLSEERITQSRARKSCAQVIQTVLSNLQRQAIQNHCTVSDFACTLIAFIVTPHQMVAMQIGDGFLVVKSEQEDYQLLFEPERGEFVNETTFITSSNAVASMQVKILSHPIQFICAATDGLENVALRLRDWTPFGPFFDPLAQYLQSYPSGLEDEYLIDFLNCDRLNARTDDDKTLLLCFQSQ